MADEWHWSEWITPAPVRAKADIGFAQAGANGHIDGVYDPDAALNLVRTGGADGSGYYAPAGTAPYSYQSTGRVNSDGITDTYTAQAYDSAGADATAPPVSWAWLDVGYSFGYWRERPELRRVPAEFSALDPSTWVPINPDDPDWSGVVEFEPGVDTVAVRWDDLYVTVTAPTAGDLNAVGGRIGFSPSILLPQTAGGGWSGSFHAWPPPLGSEAMALPAPLPPTAAQMLPVQPPAGSDFTIVAYTDMAVGAYSPNHLWQEWNVRPHSGATGQTLNIWYQMPRFRYRIAGPAVKPRFYVKHRDDTMRPVGFGKPAAELTVFRVPGRGRWRDLTAAEYATFGPANRPPGGMPLKVKRLDASGAVWWDHVGWMVPDA